jgi:hypothetical protein
LKSIFVSESTGYYRVVGVKLKMKESLTKKRVTMWFDEDKESRVEVEVQSAGYQPLCLRLPSVEILFRPTACVVGVRRGSMSVVVKRRGMCG